MKLNFLFRFADAAFAAFVFFDISTAFAQENVFFQSDELTIAWPVNVEYASCNADLKSKAGAACRQLGADGEKGAVFLTVHQGYELGTVDALQKHLGESEEALENIPRIHVMQSRILNRDPLIGMMEILRNDGTLKNIEGLRHDTVRQTSILIPVGNMLAQVFIYLPENDETSVLLLQNLVEAFSEHSTVHIPPVVPEQMVPERKHAGTLDLLPKALWIGGIIALIGILCISVHAQIVKTRRRREDQKLQIKLEACSNMPDEEEEGAQNPPIN